MLLLGAELIFANIPPGAGLFFEPGKRRDPSRALMPVTKQVLVLLRSEFATIDSIRFFDKRSRFDSLGFFMSEQKMLNQSLIKLL